MKKIIIFGFLIINSIAGLSQLSITVDSLRQRADTLWFSNRKGSIVYLRTLNDTLYFGDASGEKKVSQIGTGTGGLNFSDTVLKIATKYDLTQIESGSADSNFIYMTSQSARFGSEGDTILINSEGIIISNPGDLIGEMKFGIGIPSIEINNSLMTKGMELSQTGVYFSDGSEDVSLSFDGVRFKNNTKIPYGISWIPTTPHVLVTGDSTNKIVQSELGSFTEDTLPRINADTLVVSEKAYINNPHGAYFRTSDLTITASQNIYYKITGFTNKDTDGLTVAGDSIQLPKGSFLINFTCSFSGNNGEVWEIAISKNGTPENPTQLRYTSNADIGNASCPVYLYSDGNDWISFNIRNTTDGDDPTIKRFSAIITTMHLEL